tara:strand:- start:212 stop:415 length:204 start_codon:yes stop_codon:yes gene_type:complete
MDAKNHQVLKDNISDIYEAFNAILIERGMDNLRIRNFRVMDVSLMECKDLREIVRSDGTTYLKCFDD